MTQDAIVIAGRYIIVGTKCPICSKWNKTPITIIKTTCAHCSKEFEKNISVEDKETYEAELVKDYLWMIIKEMQAQHEVVFHVNENHMQKALHLASLLKRFGIDMERKYVSSRNEKTQKMMTVNEVKFKKSEDMRYHIEKSLS